MKKRKNQRPSHFRRVRQSDVKVGLWAKRVGGDPLVMKSREGDRFVYLTMIGECDLALLRNRT